MNYKKLRMDPQVLSTMFLGFQRKLFTVPTSGDILSTEEDNSDCTIYFTESFWNNYVSELQSANMLEKFSRSNASADWNRLMKKIKSAEDSACPSNASDYYEGLKMFLK